MALVLTAALATGCTAGGGSGNEPGPPDPAPHGYVEGAEESAEQQSRLVVSESTTGRTRVLDLITGKRHTVPAVEGVTALTTDGRFGYFHTSGGVLVLDSGAWTVDHGDHVHYYRADIRTVGRIATRGVARIGSDEALTAVTTPEQGTTLHPRGDLEKRKTDAALSLPGRHTAVIPFRAHLLAVPGPGGTGISVLDRQGRQKEVLATSCRDPRGDAVTRRGVVLGCADGAVLIRLQGGKFSAVGIPYPEDVPVDERARDFRSRPGSDTLTALAGDTSVWVLDVAERTWKRVETGPVLAANTAGEGAPLLALGTDGTLRGFDIETGEHTARAALGAAPSRDGARAGQAGVPDIAVDHSRAYISDPEGRRITEIDYNDSLRIARSFDLDIRPDLMVETGR
ncbi:hypothetical protein GTW66_21795 [Streptomyces sp. SID5473]|uniref:ABC transporter n=1 Tax=Streptomyces tsukubensis (strain DSM 42081 / NBRC 108919 / NRRL 18488 / 9993) TaxID=1114943 RepID=A0A7G3UM90_STRT9|nr:hypothetical protein [Streptomyces sp. SID5473]QKM71444.1 hypothetical protein STSU_007360 [Streptomyces tsukubensis NRRL18488]TAI41599.1 hypothetical protein EWI31_27095 [Streptomyces tsukubensis]